ncbi:MAG: UDP-N-acetylmuramoyl-L-alanine--D-glutamate ligase, partial [Selenomonadaceae bacterium]|nr:UDP-N-acetylmuramoyl-L-alanine--D-glutamate ligase [Selenomonadaceae bacterium]
VGDAAARFKSCALEENFPAEKILDAGYSMQRAVDLAKKISRPPQVVLLSPACASFDMYSDFEERGRDFKRIVQEL